MFHNASRSRGRPRSFDEKNALEKAVQVFWSKGYDGVTIDDLVEGMGVGRPSLYAVFGDKRSIFLRALKSYAEAKGARAAKALFAPPTLRASLAGFFPARRGKCDGGRISPRMPSHLCRAPRRRR